MHIFCTFVKHLNISLKFFTKMKTRNYQNLIAFVVLLLAVVSLSSCNRGLGCPTFSITDTLQEMVVELPVQLATKE